MKKYYKYIAIVLVYRNIEDIKEFIESFTDKVPMPSRIIIVNSYYDDATKDQVCQIAKEYDCDFINVENKGYSYGNNKGIEFATENYSFDFAIISNPDIIIKKFDDSMLHCHSYSIYAPEIITKTGKRQNPNWVHSSSILDYLQYIACKNDNTALEYLVIGIIKIERVLFNCNPISHRKNRKVYSAHGSFIIISKEAIDKIMPIFNNNMFLFHEEIHLAYKAKKNGINTYYTPFIRAYHKEDGSMKIADVNITKRSHESEVIYYEQRINSTTN